ncbi:MAG: MFS transporter [Solirubrobacterales bacterium]|nr:MFS transporter [Solirubrobacterales bacterium]
MTESVMKVLPGVIRPLVGSLVGRVPDSIASLSLVMLLRERTGSYAVAGIAAAGLALGAAVAAPLAGRALDRSDERRILSGMACAFAGAVAAIVVCAGRAPAGVVVVLAVLAGATRPPLDAAMRALWPRVVPSDRLSTAYSLDATLQELIWIAGPLLLAGLLLVGGPALGLLACAALSVAGTFAFVAALPTRPGRPTERDRAGVHSLSFASLLGAATLYGVAAGVLTLTLTAFATDHHARPAVGILVAIWGLGSILGGLAHGSVRWRRPPERRAPLLLAALAGLLASLALAPGVAVLALLMIPLGLPLSPWLGTLNEAAQRLVDPARTAEAFTWIYSLIALGVAAGNAAAGPVIEHAGTAAAFLAAAAAAGAGALIGAGGVAIARARTLR